MIGEKENNIMEIQQKVFSKQTFVKARSSFLLVTTVIGLDTFPCCRFYLGDKRRRERYKYIPKTQKEHRKVVDHTRDGARVGNSW